MPSRLRLLVRAIAYLTLVVAAAPLAAQSTITVDATAATRPFAHYWERMFGSGRAVLSLRESYRDDLRTVRRVTDIGYVRFHGIFLDDMGVYTEGPKGEPVYNFSYVDQAYDGLLANGVRPFVELSFMPRKLAARDIRQSFWYRPVVSPPKSYARWDALIAAFARHLVERYGIEEVSHWYFEVWNEPNLDFWARPAAPVDLLGAVRPHRQGTQGGRRAAAGRRSRHRPGRVGAGVHPPLQGAQHPGRLRLDARLR